MKKILTLFERNYDTDHLVRDELTPGCEWVIAGEGIATRKLDGTCCLVRDGVLYKRHEIKPGGKVPANFEPATEVDPETGKIQGWLPVGDGPEDKYHREAWERGFHADGTYELLGPKIGSRPPNAEGFSEHGLLPHGTLPLYDVPLTFDALKTWLAAQDIEGIVWHHPDGRMCKMKKRDLGLPRKPVPSYQGDAGDEA